MGVPVTLESIHDELQAIGARLATIEANQNLIHSAVVEQGKRISAIERNRSDMPLYPTPTPQPLGGTGEKS
jgi:hypothetical protein